MGAINNALAYHLSVNVINLYRALRILDQTLNVDSAVGVILLTAKTEI